MKTQPVEAGVTESNIRFRLATLDDLDALEALEEESFNNDRLSRRSLRHWIKAPHALLLLAEELLAEEPSAGNLLTEELLAEEPSSENSQRLLGYGLVWLHKGTRLARLYSLAVARQARGRKIGSELLSRLERQTAESDCFFMRLEVAKSNHSAIALYESLGYRVFGEFTDYYEDHDDALRMHKRIRFVDLDSDTSVSVSNTSVSLPKTSMAQGRSKAPKTKQRLTPWYQQTTEFTCGPAALMMAMAGQHAGAASVVNAFTPCQELELDIWREATTIFMTSGHGGCHPLGLALSARKRGFEAEAYINTEKPLFTEGVRSDKKKKIISLVHQQFLQDSIEQSVSIVYKDITQNVLSDWLALGYSVLVLISTYRLDGKKSPHWVCLTNIDEHCLYVHDPHVSPNQQLPLDCQHLPIARDDFAKMSAFGSERLRTAIAIRKTP